MNRVCLVGRLTAKPELRYTSTNKSVARFTVAINRQNEGADFINCNAWGKTAENVANYLNKGSLVSIEGRIQTSSYTDKNGSYRYAVDVIADSIRFLDTKKATHESKETYEQQEDIFADFGEQVSVDDNFLD